MSRVLLFNESGNSEYGRWIRDFLKAESHAGEIDFVEEKTVEGLEREGAGESSVDLIILVVNQVPSESLSNVISSHRNRTAFRDTQLLSLHLKFSSQGIQKALMLGIKNVFLEPIDLRRVCRVIIHLLNGDPPYLPIAPVLTPVGALGCQAEVFGRIGKIYMKPFGDLHVETDAKLPPGRAVSIRSKLSTDLDLPVASYSVVSAKTHDIFYHYHNSYHLSWNASADYRKRLNLWVTKNSKSFAFPKTKVLWIREIGEGPLGKWESAFSKSVFSVHTRSVGRLSLSYLETLNPQILISGHLPDSAVKMIRAWLVKEAEKNRIVISTVSDHPLNWTYIPLVTPQDLKQKFIELVKPDLETRVTTLLENAHFLDRKSLYSRFAIPFAGRVVSISFSHLVVDLEVEIEKNTVFLLHCLPLEHPIGSGIYLKVLKCESVDYVHPFRHFCEIVPASDQPNPRLAKLIPAAPLRLDELLDISLDAEAAEEARNAQRGNWFFLESHSVLSDVVKVLIALSVIFALGALLYLLRDRPTASEVLPSAMDSVFRSLRDAFR